MDMVNQTYFSSFVHSRIQRIRELRPQRCPTTGKHVCKTGAWFHQVPDNFIDIALSVGATEVHLKYSTCSTSRVNAIHEAGMDSMCWFRGPRYSYVQYCLLLSNKMDAIVFDDVID